MEDSHKDWKLKLRYGRLTTPYQHFTGIAEGVVGQLAAPFSCPQGQAFMGIKLWASSHDEAADMVQGIGAQIGFTVSGKVELFDTPPEEPPQAEPFGYDIQFTPFG